MVVTRLFCGLVVAKEHVTSLIKLYKIASYELFFIGRPKGYTSRFLSLPSLPGLFLCHHFQVSFFAITIASRELRADALEKVRL